MLLEEIIPAKTKTIRTKSPLNMDQFHRNNTKDNIGRGFFSTVYNDRDEHMVQKISHNSKYHDNYWDYADALIKTKIWESNPHFPRIYSIKKFVHGTETHYKGTMEKLINSRDCSSEELYACYENLIYMKSPNFYHRLIMDDKNDFLFHVSQVISSAVKSDNYTEITDSVFKEALQWINVTFEDLNSKHNIAIDMHQGNFMYRRTKYGIQLVLSDPIA